MWQLLVTHLLQWIPRLSPLYDDTPVTEGNYHEPEWFTPLMQFNDRYGFIVWPTIGVLVIVSIVVATLRAATHKTIPGPERARVKKEIIHELRRQLQGMSLEQISHLVGHHRDPMTALIVEMVKDGMLMEHVNSKGATVFKLPGM